VTSEQKHILHPYQYSTKKFQHEERFGQLDSYMLGFGTKRNIFVSCGTKMGFDLETIFF